MSVGLLAGCCYWVQFDKSRDYEIPLLLTPGEGGCCNLAVTMSVVSSPGCYDVICKWSPTPISAFDDFLFLFTCSSSADLPEGSAKLLNVFNIVSFPNDPCVGSSATGQYGSCYTASQCQALGKTIIITSFVYWH